MNSKEQKQLKRRLQQFTETILFLESLKTSSYLPDQREKIDRVLSEVQELHTDYKQRAEQDL